MDGELIGNVVEEAKLPRVCEIHGQYVGGAGHVHLATEEEGEVLGIQVVWSELRHESPREWAHHTERCVQRSHILALKEVKKSLSIRTKLDKKRKHSPLKKMKDAILIRTDVLNKKQVLIKMSKSINQLD